MKLKSIEKIKLNEFDLILKIVEKNSKIILTEENPKNTMSYAEVVSVGSKVEDIDIGDVVVDFRNPKKELYTFSIKDERYIHASRHDILMVTSKDNIIIDEEKISS